MPQVLVATIDGSAPNGVRQLSKAPPRSAKAAKLQKMMQRERWRRQQTLQMEYR
jgi:hypothetical protein